ncbi:MAG: error-prone DNA polymerase [Gammaproteobacteria bacterium]|nr:error-prone DNA polymerase [Gammaproteobacteria bacterium]
MSAPGYAELHCLSNFTFLKGASHPEELVAQAAALGYQALAITDECSVAGVVRAWEAAREHGIKLLIGAEFRLEEGPTLVVLARDREGYNSLCRVITRGRRAADKGDYLLHQEDLADGLPGCWVLWIPGDIIDVATGQWLKGCFGERARLVAEWFGSDERQARFAQLEQAAMQLHLPIVACGGVQMHVRGRRALQDTLTAIRLRLPLAIAGYHLNPNGERHLRSRERIARIYPSTWREESLRLAASCTFRLDELRYEYPEELVPAGETPTSHLQQLTRQGMKQRWPQGAPDSVQRQVEHELRLIAEMRYEPFFLTVHDVVAFARSRDILCQGRGSAANSAVCFCLGITEVDPARMSLVFERFISKERDEPPDIDVDFEHERREEVIQYIYAKYGRERAALAATVITYRPRSAVRDVGKALGLASAQVENLARAFQWWDGRKQVAERIESAGLDPANPVIHRLCVLVDQLLGFPRHLSQHVGGFVIARNSLDELVPVENASMAERTVIQWDKDDLESLGLLKVDVLALGMLTAIRRALDMVNNWRGSEYSLATVPAEDPDTYAMIQQADTMGVFQIESRAQMAMLPRLRPACFYDLVIEVAIVRPGPIQGDMVHPYLRRRCGEETVSYPSDAVRHVLERTLGVPIFQEQAMQLAVVAAGFTPGEADRLRRAMAAWRKRGGIEPFRERLLDGMRDRGYSEAFAEQIYRQLQGFGEYGFPESHSASFALLVYVSAWLKCHEPAAFCAALLNSQPMGFYAPAQLVQDAQRHGVNILPVDVQCSDWDSTLERQADSEQDREPAVRLGLSRVRSLDVESAERLVAARRDRVFQSVNDLARRAGLSRQALEALAAADALRSLGGHRHRAFWNVAGVEAPMPLIREPEFAEALPMLAAPTEGQNIVQDYAQLGLTLGRHPLALLRARLLEARCRSAAELWKLPTDMPVRVAGIVINRQRPSTAKGVTFMTLEDETGQVNLIIWRKLAEQQRKVMLQSRLLVVDGQLQRQGDVLHVIAGNLEDRSEWLGRLATRSRDFH